LSTPKAPKTPAEEKKKAPAPKTKKAAPKKGKAAASDEEPAEAKEPEKQIDPEELKKKKEKEGMSCPFADILNCVSLHTDFTF
jgi:hypothetical protein